MPPPNAPRKPYIIVEGHQKSDKIVCITVIDLKVHQIADNFREKKSRKERQGHQTLMVAIQTPTFIHSIAHIHQQNLYDCDEIRM